MNRDTFVKAIKFPFQKLDQGVSKLVGAVVPAAAQEKIARSEKLVFGLTIFCGVVAIAAAPAAVGGFLAGAFSYRLLAGYCQEHVDNRKSSQTAAQDKAPVPAASSSAVTEDAGFKPNALSPDFKSAKDAVPAANQNSPAPDTTAAAVKNGAPRAP